MKRALLLLLALAACGGEESRNLSSSGPCKDRVVWKGTPAAPAIPMNPRFASLIVVPVTVDGRTAEVILDSGAPVSALDPAAFGAMPDPSESWQPEALVIGGVTIVRPEILPNQLIAGTGLAGLIGGDLLCPFALSVDYRGHALRLGRDESAIPADVAAPVSVPFTLQGGLDFEGFDLHIPATRIPVTIEVEGVSSPMLLDTGASVTALRTMPFARMVGDGRKVASGLPAITAMGSTMLRISRARRITAGGASVEGLLVGEVGEQLSFPMLEGEVGHPIDGLLGASFLRAFHTTLDYPAGVLELRAYPPASLAPDDLTRVGVLVEGGKISFVFEGSEAATKGLRQGTVIRAIDGMPIAGLEDRAVDEKLRGQIGKTVTLTTPDGEVVLHVEDLIAL